MARSPRIARAVSAPAARAAARAAGVVPDVPVSGPVVGGPIGVNGLRITQTTGYVWEETEPDLRGMLGMRTYERIAREPIIAAGLHAIDTVVRGVEWQVIPKKEDGETEATPDAQREADWLRDMLLDEPSGWSWPDFVSEALTFMVCGYSLFEHVWERRDDGRVGIADIQPRAQTSILRWALEPDQRAIRAVVQIDPVTGAEIAIPYAKCLHLVPNPRKRNPEGVSLLRPAYKDWKRKQRLEWLEDVGTERDLTGVPVMYVPSTVFHDPAAKAAYTKLVRDARYNEQAGFLLPSDPFLNDRGEAVGGRSYELSLLSAPSTRDPGMAEKIGRIERRMARLLLTEFLLLGEGSKGSWALSADKTDFLASSIKVLLSVIAAGVNKRTVSQLWALNGLSPETRPTLKPGEPAREDLTALASYVSSLAGAGARLFPDDRLEDDLRSKGGLPPMPPPDEREPMPGDTVPGADGRPRDRFATEDEEPPA